ncbi:TonB-dependent receptor [Gramella sp. AN32]|uniref:SusC/RagA family TonB-linked outer membrane protein n=1 Tax=Christiangramia antarctica TaxID=2058158 RepID=A0ABW5X3W4_9FLAO|nr:TonB-dependent receptor [Gramella sp. AN32]MCM4155765.1 SusC/RagA family TonB-linked outer membrane protein [Gramella sp. AN32]
MKNDLRTCFLVLVYIFSCQVWSQTQQVVTGTVIDDQGIPLPGVSVMVKGTAMGTATNFDGEFSLSVSEPKDAVLVFSFLGYQPQEIAVDLQTTFNITLKQSSEGLDEILIVGYGTQNRKELIGSVAQISSEDIEDRPIAQLRTALTGQMAGVTVTDNTSRPGRPSGSISIRGVGSFGASPQALILVDGIPVDNFNDVNPSTVKTISVLKDASSAAIYGSRAANGVILITTKSGTSGKPKITYEGYLGIETPTAFPDYVNSWEYQEAYFEAENNSSVLTQDQQNIVDLYRAQNDPEYPNTDFLRSVLSRDGIQNSHRIGISGGTDRNTYILSLGYLHQDGLVIDNDFSRYNIRLNLDTKISDKLNLTTRLSAINSDLNEPLSPAGVRGFNGYMMQIIQQAARLPGTFVGKYENGDYGQGLAGSGTPISNLDSDSFNTENSLNLNGNLRLDYSIIPNLKMSFITSYIRDYRRAKRFRSTQRINENILLGPNELSEYFNQNSYYTIQGLADYNKKFNKHEIGLLLGYSFEDYDRENLYAFRDNFPGNDLSVLDVGSPDNQRASGSGSETTLESQFARLKYNFASKYLIEGVIRRDGSSRFPTSNKYAIFPSVAVGWRIGEEKFIEDNFAWINELKLKASWGVLGNQNISDYAYQNTLNSSTSYAYSFGGTISQGVAISTIKDSDLKWESTRTQDLGLEVGLFKNRLNFSAAYYDRYTYDILYSPASSVSGVLGFGISEQNTGELENTGWEFTLNHNNNLGDFSYNIGANYSIVNNKVLSLGVGNVEQPNGLVGNGSSLFVGYPIQTYYGYIAEGLFVDQNDVDTYADQSEINPNVQAGDVRYKDLSGPEGVPDGKVDDTYDRTYLGSRIPKYSYGINLGASYKGFDFSMLLQGFAGVKGRLSGYAGWAFYNTTGNIQRWQYEGHWTAENPNRDAVYPRLETVPGGGTPNTILSSYWLLDASYMRIKNAQLGYNLPEDFLQSTGIANLKIYISGENLGTFSNYRQGWDPEISTDGEFYPIYTTYTLGLNLSF